MMSEPSVLRDLEYYKAYRPEPGELDLASYLLDEEAVAEQVASAFYPTPLVLAELQRSLGQAPGDPSAANPEPFPPRRLKTEIFDAAKYVEKDVYVKLLRPEPLESDVEFAVRLFMLSSSNLDSVRAAFCFVCSVPVDELTEVEGETEFYRRALTAVPTKQIVGYKKGAGYESGMEARRSGGNWTACYVEGEWRLVDPLWGAQILSDFDTGNYAKVDEKGNVLDVEKSDGKLIYGCNEFYFLTDPQNLILTHLPVEELSQWQLLARPLTLAEFHRMPKFYSGSLEEMLHFSVNPVSHPLNVILGQPGNVEVYLRETAGQKYDYKAGISIHKSSISDGTRAEIKEHASVSGYLSKMTRMSDDTVRFKFVPPCSGKFMLSIYLLRVVEYPDKIVQHGIEYVSYVIHCPRADKSAETLPVGCADLMHFGTGAKMAAARLQTDEPGEIKVEDGERLIRLESTDHGRSHRLDCQLYGVSNQSLSSKNLLTWRAGPNTSIQFLSPDSGSFALVIRDRGVPLCQFLLDSDSEFRDCASIPLPDQESLSGLGIVNDELEGLIVPVSHPDPYIRTEESTLELKFTSTARLDIKAELLYTNLNGAAEDFTEYTFVTTDSEGIKVEVRLKIAGNYILKLFFRRRSAEPWQEFMKYFIRCVGQLDGRAEQFPEVRPGWKSENMLLHPKRRLLPLHERVLFSLRVNDPSFKVAYLLNESKNEHTVMQQQGDRIWRGSIEGFDDCAGSAVKVLGGPSVNACSELLTYRFELPNDHMIRNMEMHSAAKLNLSRLENERLRKRKQVNHERKQRALEPLPLDAPLDIDGADLQLENELKQILLNEETTLEEVQEEALTEEPTLVDVAQESDTRTLVEANFENPPAPHAVEEAAPDQQVAGERPAIADWLNKNLRSDPDCQKYLPIEDIYEEIEKKFDDGVLLCGVVNAVSEDTIDRRALHRGGAMSHSDRIENITMALNSAKSLGVPISSEPADLASSPQQLLELLGRLIWVGLTDGLRKAIAADSQKLRTLFSETEDVADVRSTTPEQLLVRWVNYHLRQAGFTRQIENLGSDLADSEVYAHLLQQVTPSAIRDCMHPAAKIVSQQDLLVRAQLVLQNADLLDVCEFLRPAEIVSGNAQLNSAFVANLYNRFPCLPEPEFEHDGQPVSEQLVARPPELIREEMSYTNWLNSAGVEPRVNCLYTDMRSGVQYLQLLDQLRPGLVTWSRVSGAGQEARARFKHLENCNYAVELGRQLGFSLVGIGGEDLAQGNETLTLAMLHQLVMARAPAAVARTLAHLDSRVAKTRQLLDERTIVEWANEQLNRGGKDSRLVSFHDAALGDCRCLLDLIDCVRTGSVDYSFVLPGATEEERLRNARLAISLIWRAGAQVFASPVDVAQARPRMLASVFAALMQLSCWKTTDTVATNTRFC